MFPNNSISNNNSSTIINSDDFYNNSYSIHRLCVSHNIQELVDRHAEIVVITQHLCVPCPRLYTDIFKTILIICKDQSHKGGRYADDDHINHLIQQLLEGESIGYW